MDDLEIRNFDIESDKGIVGKLTDLLHEAYRPLAERGMKYFASYQPEEITLKRLNKGEGFLVFHKGTLAGTITLAWDKSTSGDGWLARKDVAFAGQFAVRPDLQRGGIGRALLDTVEKRAKELGFREIAIDTSEHADELIEMYDKRGYRFIEYVDWDVTNFRSVVMSKTLIPE
jgi:GNAT superfamily N-acetyltransferase